MNAVRLALRYPTLAIVSALHLVWGVALILSPGSNGTTVLYLTRPIVAPLAGLLGLLMAYLGFWAITRPKSSWLTLWALIPQQVSMVIMSTGILYSVWIGRFLDGVVRSRGFLFADHACVLLLTAAHVVVLLAMHSAVLRPEPSDLQS